MEAKYGCVTDNVRQILSNCFEFITTTTIPMKNKHILYNKICNNLLASINQNVSIKNHIKQEYMSLVHRSYGRPSNVQCNNAVPFWATVAGFRSKIAIDGCQQKNST